MTGPQHVHGRPDDREDDALGRMDRDALERVLAAYYRDVGWWVEDAGAARPRRDDEVGLRLRRGHEVVLVQCRHWGAKQATDADVHALLAAIANERATGAILVCGGFTAAAIETATRLGRVKLIDGEALRGMLGALPERPDPSDPFVEAPSVEALSVEALSVEAPPPRAPSRRPPPVQPRRWPWLATALLCALGFVLIVRAMLDRTADTAGEPPPEVPKPPRPTIVIDEARPAAVPATAPEPPQTSPRRATEAEIRETQRKADEAIRAIEDTPPSL